jgi:hypothetical protein
VTGHADAIIQGARIYIIVAGCLVAVVGTAQISRWRSFLPANQLAWLSLAAFNFSAVFGTIDVYVKDIPGGTRTFIAAVATTFALYAVLHHPLHRLRRWREARRVIRRYDR